MTRATFSIDERLVDQARQLGINISAAARDGVAAEVRAALAESDRAAYLARPETVDEETLRRVSSAIGHALGC